LVVNDNGKGHDTIGVAKNSDGSLSIAVADGVSGGVIPKVASRLIVGMALEDMRQTQPLGQILEHAFVEIQATDIPFMARREIQDWETRSRTNPDPIEKTAIDGYIGILKERMEKDDLTATTLGLAKYDRVAGRLQIALKSDTSAHIFHADGTVSDFQNPDMS